MLSVEVTGESAQLPDLVVELARPPEPMGMEFLELGKPDTKRMPFIIAHVRILTMD